MTTLNTKLSESEITNFFNQESYAEEIQGLIFEAIIDTHEHDNHGGAIYKLVLKRTSDAALFAGELTLNTGEGEIYEFPSEFKSVERKEKQIIVVDYEYN